MSKLKILNHIRLKAFYNNRKTIPLTQYEHDESGILCNLIDSQNKTINLSDCTAANFYGDKPDGTIVGIKCIIENNSVIVPIKLQMTTAAGQLNGALELSFGNGNVRFYGLNFIVSASANMDKIKSTDEFTILETTIEEAKELLKFADEKLDKPLEEGKAGQVLTLDSDGSTKWTFSSGGSGGTTNYDYLINKPKINGLELQGNLTTDDLGIKDGKDYVLTDEDKQEIVDDVLSQVNVEVGSSGDVLLIDFTTTEEVEMIDIPLNDVFEQINNSAKLIFTLKMGMPVEASTETSKHGKVTASFFSVKGNYNPFLFFTNKEIAPTNSISYGIDSRTMSIVEKSQDGEYPCVIHNVVKKTNVGTMSELTLNIDWKDLTNLDVLRITSEIPMAVGTKVKLYQRGVLE